MSIFYGGHDPKQCSVCIRGELFLFDNGYETFVAACVHLIPDMWRKEFGGEYVAARMHPTSLDLRTVWKRKPQNDLVTIGTGKYYGHPKTLECWQWANSHGPGFLSSVDG